MKFYSLIISILIINILLSNAQEDKSLLTIDRIYASNEFRQGYHPPIKWIENGEAYITLDRKSRDFVRYETATQEQSIYLATKTLISDKDEHRIRIKDFTLSNDESKILIFTNSKKVWRSNTKGDYWVYDFNTKKLSKVGNQFPESSLMFAKFSDNNKYIAYVHEFNIYKENFKNGEIEQLTSDGSEDIINGTFDWVYEEEFGCRDGFRWNANGKYIAFWQVDASEIKDFYLLNNTDENYSEIVPVQYPKVGEEPSSVKVGVVHTKKATVEWIPVPGDAKAHFIPRIQWLNNNEILVQQLNRKQNKLVWYVYNVSTKIINEVYIEKEDTWVDIDYPDVASNSWGMSDEIIMDEGKTVLRMTENDGWRHVYKINLENSEKTLITNGDYDVADKYLITETDLYFNASPENSTQRYLYSTDLAGNGNIKRLTPNSYNGINQYNISPNGKYAVHKHSNSKTPRTQQLISLPDHKKIVDLVTNEAFKAQMDSLSLPDIEFFKVTTEAGIEIDGKMIKPLNFDINKKYPVFFYVYGEPARQVCLDSWENMWRLMLAQKGYLVIMMDNRGTPCLKGSEWRKSIYRKIGGINVDDQAAAAAEILKWDFVDTNRISVHGWSGGGSMTLNLMFRYPKIYKTGMSVAPVANQLMYDNIYQERYMGLPNEEDFINGSPISHAKNLQGNLLVIHGTGDDNVHYQNTEMLINELIKHNKQFQVMPYPNRAHGIRRGKNTRLHLYTLMTNYLMEYCPPGGR